MPRVNPLQMFRDVWIQQFATSVEMFTGTAIVPGVESPELAARFAAEPRIWQEQTFTREGSASVWVGLPASCCLTLTAEASSDQGEALSLYRELLSQSLQATAQVLNTGELPGMRCGSAFTTDAPPSSVERSLVCVFTLGLSDLPLTLRFDESLELLLAPPTPAPVEAPAISAPVADEASLPPTLERFVGVDLPVRVVLGRATLRVRDILKLTVGSLIELDTRPGDLADLCVHDAVLARGEVVAIRGNYGVRIARIMTERDRMTLQLRGRPRPPVLDSRGRPERVH